MFVWHHLQPDVLLSFSLSEGGRVGEVAGDDGNEEELDLAEANDVHDQAEMVELLLVVLHLLSNFLPHECADGEDQEANVCDGYDDQPPTEKQLRIKSNKKIVQIGYPLLVCIC